MTPAPPPGSDACSTSSLRAARDGGAALSELARELGVDPATLHADLREVQERSFYLPPGSTSDIQIILESDRVHAFSPGELRRPVRLSHTEALVLGLGLRLAGLSPSAGPDPAAREALRRRLEAALAAPTDPEGDVGPGGAHVARAGVESYDAPALEPDPSGVRETLAGAIRQRTPCRIRYVKPDSAEPRARPVHPLALVSAEGHWYLAAHCLEAGDLRHFRLDRVIDVALEDGVFEAPAAFDPRDSLDHGRVFRSHEAEEARVRYGPRVARRIAESDEGEWTHDGSFVVRHPVADRAWLVRLILGYGGEAEVLEPEEVRGLVRREAARLGVPPS